MGFQSAINQGLGAGAAAAVAIASEHDQEKKKIAQEQGLLAKEQYYEAKSNLTKLTGEQEAAKKTLDEKTARVDATKGWNMTGKNKSLLEAKAAKRLTEQEAAQRAFDELADRIEARQAMMSRAEVIMKRTNTWGGMR